MKRIVGVILALCMVLAFVACASKPEAPPVATGGMPAWVQEARRTVPEGVLVGIGSAKLATVNQSMNTSETRARAQIVRAMNSMVKNMIEDYTASSEVDTSAAMAFQAEVSVSLAKAQLSGAQIKKQDAEPDGTWWTVVYLDKADVVKEINQAQAAAKLAVPQAAAISMEDRMDARFDQAKDEDWFE